MKKYKIGYTQGTYDLFHIGHLNLLENAKKQCDYLIVGVNSDDLVYHYKKKVTASNQNERAKILSYMRMVDKVIITNTLDKEKVYEKIKFDAIFIGDDWKGNDRWKETEQQLSKYGVPVVYLPHTDGISSTMLRSDYTSKMEAEKIDE